MTVFLRSFNLTHSGSIANLILESTNSTITNQGQVSDHIEKIVDTLKSDNSISEVVKKEVLATLNQVILEMNQENKVTKSTWNNIVSMGSNISSIDSLVLSLGQLINL